MERIKELNIMTDNLVQFLPQERVIDFSLMSPIALLENTEKTIGQLNLFKMHEELKTAGNKWMDVGVEIDRLRKSLDDARDKEVQLKLDVDNLAAQEKLATAMGLAALKKDRLALVDQQEELKNTRKGLDKFSKDLNSCAKKILPFQKKIAKGKAAYSLATRSMVQAKRTVEEKIAKFRPDVYASEPDKLQHDNVADQSKLTAYKRQHEERQNKIGLLENAVTNLRAQAAQMDVGDTKERLTQIGQEAKRLRDQVDALVREKNVQITHKRKVEDEIQNKQADLQRLEQSDDERVRFLRQHNESTYRAYQWVEQNRNQFRGQVYGPLFLEINLKEKSEQHAAMIESLIPREFLNMFIFQEDEDLDLMMSEVVTKMRVRVPLKRVPMGTPMKPAVDPNQLRRQVDCQTLVADLFEAPEPVFVFLCNRFQMLNIPVYSNWNNDFLANFKRSITVNGRLLTRKMFAGKYSFSFRTTRFSSNIATTNVETRPSQLLERVMHLRRGRPDVAPFYAELEQLHTRLLAITEKEKTVQEMVTAKQEEYSTVNRELGQGRTAIQEAERLARRIADTEKEVDKLRAVIFDFAAEQRKVAETVKARNTAALKKLLGNFALNNVPGELLKESITITVDYAKARGEMQKQGKTLRKHLQTIATTWNKYGKEIKQHDRQLRTYKDGLNNHIERIKDIPGSANGRLSAEALQQYVALSADMQQLENLQRAKRAQLNAAGDININARRDLEKHVASMRNLEEKIAEKNSSVEKEKERMARLRSTWMNTIDDLVTKIGNSFSDFYKLMNLAGDVVLLRPNNPDHFENYGFEIKVSYRTNRPLETLSGQVHSGGEKSVATALYMLAIQELTKCPFRVVDEINQGMDADNERRVFKMIVETASRCGGQYFILSPKLLPDLHLTKDVTVTVIFAGSEMHSGLRLEPWSLASIIKAMVRLNNVNGTPMVLGQSSASLSRGQTDIRKRAREPTLVEDEVETSPTSLKENPVITNRRRSRQHERESSPEIAAPNSSSSSSGDSSMENRPDETMLTVTNAPQVASKASKRERSAATAAAVPFSKRTLRTAANGAMPDRAVSTPVAQRNQQMNVTFGADISAIASQSLLPPTQKSQRRK
ncbi:structural maintenance of chromosomes protein 5-like isoform X2 [Paramacrobiotus metropolitanus]|nr:structural maintenance of chromosomes protein 5-like isoform X2 [Paramacrobiotus metropolitanus]